MSREREELVEAITRAVMDRLRGGSAATAPPSRPTPEPARPAPTLSVGSAESSDADTRERLRMFSVTGVRSSDETRVLHEAGAERVVATMGYCPASDGLGRLIDHTLLKPDADKAQIEQLCREAAQFCFASVCFCSVRRPQAWSPPRRRTGRPGR